MPNATITSKTLKTALDGTEALPLSVTKYTLLSWIKNYILTTPNIGVASATSVNKVLIVPPASAAMLALDNGSTLGTTGGYSCLFNLTGNSTPTVPTTGTLATLAGSETLSGKTLTAPKLANGGFIADANGNELIKGTTTSSAVNEITVANAATGSAPTIAATGGDSNIDLTLSGKGTGSVNATSLSASLQYTSITGDGAITIESGAVVLSKGTAAAITIAAPSSQNGTDIIIASHSDAAHVVNFTGGTLRDGTTGGHTTATFAAFKGASLRIMASGTEWLVVSNNAVTIT